MSKNIIVPLLLTIITITFFLPDCQVHAKRIDLVVTASDVRKIIVAVPDFSQVGSTAQTDKGRSIASLLEKGLEMHGFIDIIDRSSYGGIKDADWQTLQADYVVMGNYDTTKGMLIEGRMLDVGENRLLAGRRYNGSGKQQDEMTLRLCDALIEEFSGEPGISRTSLAYVSDETGRKEVYISDILGQRHRQVTKHKHLTVSPRFSPDGNYLAYSTYHRGNQDLYITDLRQNSKTRSLSRRKGMNLAPAFAPDGRTMVVTLSKDGSPDLYLMDRKGNVVERLTKRAGINVSPSFSPDGKSLAFVSDRSSRPQVYIMDMRTRKVKRMTFQGSENSEPDWSPKGDAIAFTGLEDGRYQIFTMDTNGNNVRKLTSGWGDFESPTWSPDGKQIAFARRRNGNSEICVVGKNGKGLRVLLKLKGNQAYPQWSGRPKS